MRSFFSLGSLVFLTACVSSGPETVAKLSAKPALDGGSYSAGGGITVATDIREKDGKTMVCGVWAEGYDVPKQLKERGKRVMSSGAVYVGSKRVAQDLQFMRKIAPQNNYGGQDAKCQITGQPWKAEYASLKPDVRIPQQILNTKGSTSPGQGVKFRQTGPGAGSPDIKRVVAPEPLADTAESRNRPKVAMTPGPFVMQYTYRPYGEMRLAAMITESRGRVAVCGFWAKFEREQAYVKSTNLLQKSRANAKVMLDGKTILHDMSFMNQVRKEDFATGTPANCKQTDTPWASGYSNERITIRSPRLKTFE